MRCKYLPIVIAFSLRSICSFAQQDTGFTDKSEAKNLTVNGLKDGKWIEYFKVKDGFEVETKSKSAPVYHLAVYSAGKPVGVVKGFYKKGKLKSVIPYVDGIINGVRKEYN